MYKLLIRPLLFLVDPEAIHHIAFYLLRLTLKLPGSRPLMRRLFSFQHPQLERELMGLRFKNPIGLAAGFDKDAREIDELAELGFGFLEIGTLTPQPQSGNDRPRLFRLPKDQALINRMGFNNEGVLAAVERLKKRKSDVLIGGNIGKNKMTPNERAFEDYNYCFEALYPYVDYFVVNVSSPNTPGLRQLQERDAMKELFSAVGREAGGKPVLVKMAPDLDWHAVENVLSMAESSGLAGVIATNTTTDHSAIPERFRAEGGLSGLPLRDRAMEILRFVKQRSKLPVISVGGIMSADEALRRLDAGADLVQIYSGFIYRGPTLIREILKRIPTG